MEATVEVAVVMEAAAGARWRTESPAEGGERGTSAPLRWDPRGTPLRFGHPAHPDLFVLVTDLFYLAPL